MSSKLKLSELQRMMSKKNTKASRLNHQIWLANENPEPVFDLSDCDLTDVPAKTYSTCKYSLKEALILHTNRLSSLTGNKNKLDDLSNLLILDLHGNHFTKLPKEIAHLTKLQVLNVSKNKLKALPREICQLPNLQTLNLSDNQLTCLPDDIQNFRSLRSLNISSNKITKLPVTLCRVRTLESLNLDATKMVYPEASIASQGIEAIMKKLCSDCGVEYIPPSKAVLPLLHGSQTNQIPEYLMSDHPDHVQSEYEKYQDMKRKQEDEALRHEQEELENEEKMLSILKHQDALRRQQMEEVNQQNKNDSENLKRIQQKKDELQKQLIASIIADDERAHKVISEIIKRNTDGEKIKQQLEEIEEERQREQAQIAIQAEEISMLRKQEMMQAMRWVIEENKEFEVTLKQQLERRVEEERHTRKQLLTEEEMLNAKMQDLKFDKDKVISDMLKQEEYQRQAFESMMKVKDSRHAQLTSDIAALEEQLARLSIIEMNNRATADAERKKWMEQQRVETSKVLMHLMEQRAMRGKQLEQMMRDMEKAKEEEFADFWLAQMQRLMDWKPQALVDRETQLELAVIDILQLSNADDYIPNFARHKISIETMNSITDDDLRKMGVYEVGTRKSILKNAKSYLEKIGLNQTESGKQPDADTPSAPPASSSSASLSPPSAPTLSRQLSNGPTGTTRPTEVLAHVTTECVICMERDTNIVFLPCGHVCCCLNCCQSLYNCPMCRAEIQQKIILEH